MSFQQYVESHRKSQHQLRIETFVHGERLWSRVRKAIALKLTLLKARAAFKRFSKAHLDLDMALMDAKHATVAHADKAKKRLRKAQKKFTVAKRGFRPDE